MHFYRGNIHIHSNLSDGAKSVYDITAIAKEKGLDFIILNDHNVYSFEESGFRQGLFVIVGTEMDWRTQHMLVVGDNSWVKSRNLDPQQVVDYMRDRGLTVIAHPFEKGSPHVFRGRRFKWEDWDIVGVTGLEVWNYSSQWKDSVKSKYMAFKNFVFTPANPIVEPCEKSVQKFDEMSLKSKTIAIGGSDAHGRLMFKGLVEILSYRHLFGGINNYIFTKDKLDNKDSSISKILNLIKDGKSYIANEHLGVAKGFRFKISSDSKCALTGDEIQLSEKMYLEIENPSEALIIIKRNGEEFSRFFGKTIKKYISQKGIYRAEVWRKDRLWIFSNNIYVR